MRLLKEEFKKVNLFIEVRDARIPVTSQNHQLIELLPQQMKRVVVYNKMDLANQKTTLELINQIHEQDGLPWIHTSTKTNSNISKLLKKVAETSPQKFKTVGTWAMIGGVPNIGKSTLINALRAKDTDIKSKSSRAGARTGAGPCLTKSISGFKVVSDPLMYLVDTPGIIVPKIREESEDGLKLAACHAIRDGILEDTMICDYVLYQLNKNRVFGYVKKYDLPYSQPTDDIYTLLGCIQTRLGLQSRNDVA